MLEAERQQIDVRVKFRELWPRLFTFHRKKQLVWPELCSDLCKTRHGLDVTCGENFCMRYSFMYLESRRERWIFISMLSQMQVRAPRVQFSMRKPSLFHERYWKLEVVSVSRSIFVCKFSSKIHLKIDHFSSSTALFSVVSFSHRGSWDHSSGVYEHFNWNEEVLPSLKVAEEDASSTSWEKKVHSLSNWCAATKITN